MEKYCVMLLSCDKYSDLWPVFFGQFEKYWPDYKGYIFLNTESLVYPQDKSKNQLKYSQRQFSPSTPWAYRLLQCLKQIDEEYVLLLLDDFILTDFVDNEEISRCITYMDNDKSIACFNYLPTKGPSVCRAYDKYELKNRKSPFRINLQAALWRKNFLIKFIRKHENPWQFESWGSIRARRYSDKIYHLRNDQKRIIIYPNGGVLADERWHEEESIEIIKREGYDLDFSKRAVYHKGDPRKTEIVHRSFIKKCYQVFKSLI